MSDKLTTEQIEAIRARYEALVRAARVVLGYATLTDDPEVREIEQIWLDDLSDALAALEGESHD